MYLMTAIDSLDNAIEIFKAEKTGGQASDPNHYGLALSNYAIGFTYMTFTTELCRNDERFNGFCEPSHVCYLVDSEQEGLEKAKQSFMTAFDSFDKAGHLFGMYMSKQHEMKLSTESEDPETSK